MPAGLTLTLADASIPEGLGTTGTVTRTDTDLSQPLTVWLSSFDSTEAVVPASVEVPAGHASASFPVTAADDAESDGAQSASLYAETTDPATYASASLRVLDDDSPPTVRTDEYGASEDETLTVSGFGVLANDSTLNDDLAATVVTGPGHGTLALNPGGGFSYTPEPNYFGPDSFTYRATDPAGLSGEATVSLTVRAMDDPTQVAVPRSQTVLEDTPLTFSAASGSAIVVTDIDSPRVYVELGVYGILTIQSTAGLEFPYPQYVNNAPNIIFYADSPAEVNAVLEGLVYTPYPNETFSMGLSVFVRDETFGSYPPYGYDVIPITVTPVNDAPAAVDDGLFTVEAGELLDVQYGGWLGSGVLSNDTDVDADSLSAVLVSGPAHGTLTLNADGTFTYTAEVTYRGTDTFTYRAADGQFQSDSATVTIQVYPQNLPPVGAADSYTVDEDGGLAIGAPGVLGNDSDPEGQRLSAQLVSGPAHGSLVLLGDGGFYYTPHANYHGPDGFWYRATDGVRFSDSTYVALTVNSVNDVPVAAGNAYALDEDTTLTVPAAGVLANDTDSDGDPLTAARVSGPSHGTVTVNPDGSFTYTPHANYSGPDSFTYRAVDAAGAWGEATVSLTVRAANDAPVALDDAYAATEETPFSVIVPGVTSLTMVSDTGDYIGQGQTWSYGSGATYSIYNTYPSNPTSNNAITVRVTAGSDWWYLDFHAPNNARFVPGTTYTGATRFPFNDDSVPGMDISGNGRGSNTLTGWFRVDEVAYGPAGEVLVFAVTFEQHSEGRVPALRGTVRYNAGATAPGGVLLNDTDAEGSPLTATLVEGPANGQLVFNPNGTFMYTPNPNFFGVDTFRYKVSDGTLESAPATVTLTVAGVNDGPVNTVPGTQTLVEDTTVTFSAANGNAIRLTDIDAGNSVVELRLTVNGFLTFPTTTGLTFVTGSNGVNIIMVRGTLADLNAALDGMVFRPGANFTGNYSLQVTTSDLGNTGSGGAHTDTDYVTLNITAVNDAPRNVVPLVTPVTAEDTPLTFSPVVWVTDVDQTTGAYYAPVRVTVEFAAGTGTLSVTPSTGTTGTTVTGNGTGRVVLDGAIVYVNSVLRTLVFTPAADANDLTAPVQVRITTDDLANGGPGALTDTDTFAISVTPANDPPQLILSAAGFAVPLNSGARTVAGFASGVVGPATALDEQALQTLSFGAAVVATTGTLAFAAAPTIAVDGTLSFTPAAGTWGTATVRGWASDGFDVTPDQTLTLTVTNDAPTTAGLPAVWVAEDAAPASVTLTDHFADTEDGAAGLTYAVVGNTNPALFASVSVSGGVLTLGYVPDASGSATITVRATDSGGRWVEADLAVTVASINDAPSFVGGSGVTVASDAGPQTAAGWATAISRGPGDEAGQALTFEVTTDSPLMFAVQPAVDPATGTLTFTPVAGASGTATVTVVLRDDGGGTDAAAPATFTITLTPSELPPGVQVIGTELVITGGTGADSITVSTVSGGNGSNGAKITGTVNGQSVNKTFRQTLTRVRVSAGGGNDTVTIASGITLPTVLDGGTGDDLVKGGGGPDLVFGGVGKDNIQGNGGDDDVDAGSGDDTVTGGAGRDLLLGGAGNDTLRGGDGNDLLVGGLGADQLYGENDHDLLVGGSAVVRNPAADSLRKVLNDWDPALLGVYVGLRDRLAVTDDPASSDRLQGDAGTDWFWSWDLTDVLDLGPGEQRN